MRGPTGNASPVGPHVFLGGPRPQLATLPRAGYAAGPQPFRARSRPMFSVATTRSLGFLAAVLVAAAAAAPPPLVAQRPKRKAPPASAISPRADSTRSAPAGDPALRALHWRLVGPFRGGRAVAVAGDPTRPLVFYFGAVDGGVWKTTSGGATWSNVSDGKSEIASVGAIAVAPSDPNVIYVGAGEADWREDLTYGDGMWRSTDGGATWRHLGLEDTRHIAVVRVHPRNPDLVYVAAMGHAFGPNPTRGIFRSDDAGKSWERVNAEQKFMIRPWYFSFVTADPVDENTMYVLNLGTWRSVDGGRTFSRIRVPHGDCHVLWIDPRDPKRMIEGNDGGATVSFDGGATWSTVYNQPTAQFYHVATDDQFPYRIYGAQQDNSTVSIASRSDDGAITMRDWYPVGGGESGYIAPQPGDATIVYAGTYMGTLTRYDHRTAQARDVSVWLNNYDGYAAADVPYRFQWTFPIVFSPHAKNTLYATAQKVFKTTDGGGSWQAISPDLTLHDPATLGPVGGPITRDMTGTEWYATVFTFAESPVKAGVLWAGSDDGLVHVSQDGGGATWQDATPKGLAQFTRMSVLEPSHFAAAAAYLAANRYQQDDFQPYLFKTTDYGKTWTRITTGIPAGAYTRVIREDPVRRGLLFAGTETGIYVSFDDGARWQSLQLNLPRSSVRDIAIHESDLIVATHGRAFWVLDDISPLRQLSDQVPGASAHLFTPEPAVRFAGGRDERPATGENPFPGVAVTY